MQRLFAGVIVTLVLMTMLFLSSSPLTSAHQTTRSTDATSQADPINCSGTGCDGWDPYSSGCAYANAHLVQAAGSVITFSGGRVELWYSNKCQTNWALTYNQTGAFTSLLLAYALRQSDSKHVGSTVVNVASNGIIISPMLYAPSARVQACGKVGYLGSLHCTPFI